MAIAFVTPSCGQLLSLNELGQSEGLQNLAVTSLAQDSAGAIWAGTQNGVYRFDGARFERIGSAGKLVSVNALAVDGQRIWIAADGALWLWQNEHLERVTAAGVPVPVSEYPQMIAPDGSGGAWIVSNWRLRQLRPASGGGWRLTDVVGAQDGIGRTERESVASIVAGANGDLWFGCGRKICRRHGDRFETWGPEHGVPQEPWHRFLRASDGSLWARGIRHVVQLAPGSQKFVDRTNSGDIADAAGVYPLAEDAQHRIVGSARGALMRWNGHAWHRFGIDAGLPAGGRLLALLPDREGGLWLGMMGAGVLQWRGYGQWENWSVANGLPHTTVWAFARSGQAGARALYVATGAGIARFDADAAGFRPLTSTARQEVLVMSNGSDGTLWAVSTPDRLLRLTFAGSSVEQVRPIKLPGVTSASGILAQHSGDVWISTDAGLRHWHPGTSAPGSLSREETGLSDSDTPYAGCEDREGMLWFATPTGLARRALDRWDLPLKSADGISALACLRDGSLAVADNMNGIRILSRSGTALTERDVTPPALRGRIVGGILEDRRGWLWVNTDGGSPFGIASNGAFSTSADAWSGTIRPTARCSRTRTVPSGSAPVVALRISWHPRACSSR